MTFHSAASPGGIRAASDVDPAENVGISMVSLVPVESRLAVPDDCVASAVMAGSVPIMECVVPIGVVVDVAFWLFDSPIAIPPNVRLVVPGVRVVSIVFAALWIGTRESWSRSPTKSRGM